MKSAACLMLAISLAFIMQTPVFAQIADERQDSGTAESAEEFDMEAQFDALGRDELMQKIPPQAGELMRQSGTYRLSAGSMLQLSPKDFFATVWNLLVEQVKKPAKTLAAVFGIVVLCALIGGLKTASGESSLSPVFTMVSAMCVLASVIAPILDCIKDASKAVQDAALFMLSYIPMLSAAMAAAGSPVTGATYNLFLFSACQLVSQVVANTVVPLMGIYLALCIVGALVPDINIASASAQIKSIITWTLGFFLTVFVGLLSVQTMVAHSADGVTTRAAKFMIGSLVPVVGGALSEAYSAAQGCFKLLKTTLGAYGVFVSVFTFLPVLLQSVAWYMLTNLVVSAAEIIGAQKIGVILRACASVLGILISIILCFALLLIVSTTIVMVTGLGTV